MASGQAVWGIDVGKCALKAVRLRAGDDDKVELLASDYIAHAKILTQPDANRDELVANALEKFLSRNDLSNDQVVVSVPGQHTLARFSKLPPVDEKKIPEIVRYEADQQIPFDIDEVIWDYQTFQEEDSPEIEVGIFAMKRELIRDYLLHFENAGIEPVLVQAAPLALYNTAQADGMLSDETTIILDIGAENTDLIVATPYSLWTRTIPLGGSNFTDALVKSFKLSFSKAENLKQSAASSKYARQIFQAMRPIFADLVQELQRSLGFYTSTHREANLTKCLAMGNAFKLPGLQKYLQQNLGLDVERPNAFSMIAPSAAVNAPQFKEQLLSFGVAYGLALQGLNQGKITSSLLPPEIARQAVWGKKKPFFGAAAACLLVAAGMIWIRQVVDSNAVADDMPPPPRIPLDQADDIIRSDTGSNLPAFQYAQQISTAADVLRREHGRLKGEGEYELETIDEFRKLQANRVLIPKLYDVIHRSLPEPAEALRDAESPEAYRAAVEADPVRLERGRREQVFLESLSLEYDPELTTLGMTDVTGVEVDAVDPEGIEQMDEGFIVTLKCRTPNRDGVKFVSDVFMQRLRELGRPPGEGFFINRVVLVSGEPLVRGAADSDKRKDERQKGPGRGAGRGSRGTGSKAGSRGNPGRFGGRFGQTGEQEDDTEEATYIDPVTDESMDADWVFTVEFDVVLSDYPEPEEEEEDADDLGGL